MKNTAKFGARNNQSFMNRFTTQQTQNFNKSYVKNFQNQSQMNISDLQLPKQQMILINGTHQISGNNSNLYNCSICDRLRSICPSKIYKTYEYCKNCIKTKQTFEKNQNTYKIYQVENLVADHKRTVTDNRYGSFSKYQDTTFDETKGYSFNKSHNQNNQTIKNNNKTQFQEVNKVRFIQSNNIYPLRQTFQKQNPRPPIIHHHMTQKVRAISHYQPTVVEQVVFYPVIHNQIVYKSVSQSPNPQHKNLQNSIKRDRFRSEYGRQSRKRNIDKVVSHFLHSTQPDEILTPKQFRKLADSMRRDVVDGFVQEE